MEQELMQTVGKKGKCKICKIKGTQVFVLSANDSSGTLLSHRTTFQLLLCFRHSMVHGNDVWLSIWDWIDKKLHIIESDIFSLHSTPCYSDLDKLLIQQVLGFCADFFWNAFQSFISCLLELKIRKNCFLFVRLPCCFSWLSSLQSWYPITKEMFFYFFFHC